MDKLPHIVLPDQPETRLYTSTASAPIEKTVIPRNRAQHGQYLQLGRNLSVASLL